MGRPSNPYGCLKGTVEKLVTAVKLDWKKKEKVVELEPPYAFPAKSAAP